MKIERKQIKLEKILFIFNFPFIDSSLLPDLEKDIYMKFKHSTTKRNYSNIQYELENYQN